VPHNVFAAYSEGRVVSIIVVSILVGLALGLIHSSKADDVLHHVGVAHEAFEQIFEWVIGLLPIGLFCLIAGVAASVNPTLLHALLRYILVFCVAGIALLIAYRCFLWRLAGGSFTFPARALREPLLLAFLANTSIITIPSCLDALKRHLRAEAERLGAGRALGRYFTVTLLARLRGLSGSWPRSSAR